MQCKINVSTLIRLEYSKLIYSAIIFWFCYIDKRKKFLYKIDPLPSIHCHEMELELSAFDIIVLLYLPGIQFVFFHHRTMLAERCRIWPWRDGVTTTVCRLWVPWRQDAMPACWSQGNLSYSSLSWGRAVLSAGSVLQVLPWSGLLCSGSWLPPQCHLHQSANHLCLSLQHRFYWN